MNGDSVSTVFWGLLTLLTAFLSVGFGYVYYKDRDKRKLMFMVAFFFASLSFLPEMFSGWEYFFEGFRHWGPLPIVSAVLITVLSSLLRLKDFSTPFRIFLGITTASMFMAVVPVPVTPVPFFQATAVVVIVLTTYLYLTRREISSILFLLSTVCFILGNMGMTRSLGIEFIVLAYVFAFISVGLVFMTSSKGAPGGIGAFFALQKELKETKKELEASQAQLLEAQRLATIGELARWIGHDLRNPLTGIATATYYLKKHIPEMDKNTMEMLELIDNAIDYSDKIVNDLLEYSREIHLQMKEVTPKSLVEESCLLAGVPDNIIIRNLTRNQPKIRVDVKQITRAFAKLITNAIDAMPQGGKLTITSRKTNGNLQISFTDTGTGIPQENIKKIWTPLFTTKAKGMGFGLPICKRIIEAHKGEISVKSRVGEGTTFQVSIPIQPKTGTDKRKYEQTRTTSVFVDENITKNKLT